MDSDLVLCVSRFVCVCGVGVVGLFCHIQCPSPHNQTASVFVIVVSCKIVGVVASEVVLRRFCGRCSVSGACSSGCRSRLPYALCIALNVSRRFVMAHQRCF